MKFSELVSSKALAKSAAVGLTLALSMGLAGTAAAQSSFEPLIQTNSANSFGDTNLSYQNGVVYDDDLAPGRGPNQSFLVGEVPLGTTNAGSVGSVSARPIRPNSRQLIRPDGTTSAVARRARLSEKSR